MDDWPEYPLGSFVDPSRTICYGIVQPGSPYDGGVPIVRVNNFKDGRVDTSDALSIDPEIESKYQRSRLQGGELLLTLVGTMGLSAIVPNELHGWNVARAVGVIPLNKGVDKRWLNFVLRSRPAQDFIQTYANTTVQATFNLRDLTRLPIPMPPDDVRLPASELLSALDDKIDLNRRMNETLEATALVLYKDWFVDFGPTRARAEGRTPYLAPELWDLFPEALDDEDKPVGWYQSKLGNELTVLETGKRPRGGVAGISDGIPSVGAESIGKVGEFDFSKTKYVPRDFFSQMRKGHVSDGDVLIYKDGGKPGELRPSVTYVSKGFPFSKFCINEHVFRIQSGSLSQPLLYCLLSTDDAFRQMRELATGVAQPGLNQAAIKSIAFTMPDDERLLRGAEALIDPLVDGCNDISLNSLSLAQTRDLVLPKLMSGEIRLREAEKAVEAVT